MFNVKMRHIIFILCLGIISGCVVEHGPGPGPGPGPNVNLHSLLDRRDVLYRQETSNFAAKAVTYLQDHPDVAPNKFKDYCRREMEAIRLRANEEYDDYMEHELGGNNWSHAKAITYFQKLHEAAKP